MAHQISPIMNSSPLNVSRDVLRLLHRLLTSKDSNQNYMEQFESFSNVLLLLLRTIFDQNEACSNRDLIDTIVKKSRLSLDEEINVNSNGMSMEHLPSVGNICLKNKSFTEFFPVDKEKKQEKRKRKTKYSDISGDTSHIHREPKRKRRRKQLGEANEDFENAINYSRSNGDGAATTKLDTEDKSGDILLVRRLMTFLFNPETKYHQDCALAVLRSDEKLMQLFLKEKEKLGKQRIPVFKKRRLHSVGSCTPPTPSIEDTSQDSHSGDSFMYRNDCANVWKICETGVSEHKGYVSQASSTQTMANVQDEQYLESDHSSRINLALPYNPREEMIRRGITYSENCEYIDTQSENNVNYNQQNVCPQTRPHILDIATESTLIQETFFHEYF